MKTQTPISILYIPNMEYGINRAATIDKQSDEFEHLLAVAANIVGVQILSTEDYMISSYLKYGQPGTGFPNKNILYGHLNRLGHQATALAMLELIEKAGLQCSTMNNLQNN